MIAGILLAAGDSARMGEPKALLPYDGFTFIDSILNKLNSIQCQPIISILGRSAELICRQTSVDSYQCFNNPHPEQGQLSSLKIAIEHLPDNVQGFLLCLVDHPLVKSETYKSLYNTALKHPQQIIIPEYKGRHGHPVYFAKPFFNALLNTPEDQGARVVVRNAPDQVIYLRVDDEGILFDIDTPEDYKDVLH